MNILHISTYASPLGPMTLASDGEALTALWFDGQQYAPTPSAPRTNPALPVFRKTKDWLDCYFGGGRPAFVPPVRLHGTPFRQAVWELLRQIPYGETVTYKDIALQMARLNPTGRMSAQAVGGAVGHNPVSILVPCHRVVGTDGSLTGYAGGLHRKQWLLALEQGTAR